MAKTSLKKTRLKKRDAFQMLTPVLIVVSIVLAFLVGVLWQKVKNFEGGETRVSGTTGQPGSAAAPQPPVNGKLSSDQAAKIPQVSDSDHIKGSRDAEIFLIEYSDLECPFCKRFHETAQQVVDEYGGQVAWVYRHFPLDTIHSKARTEAEATECAADQAGNDGFWVYIDKIFEVTPSNNGLDLDDLPSLASQVGLDGGALESCLNSGKYKDRVESDYQSGLTAGVTGTPGNFIVNDKGEAWVIPGAVPFETLKVTIDEALGG